MKYKNGSFIFVDIRNDQEKQIIVINHFFSLVGVSLFA